MGLLNPLLLALGLAAAVPLLLHLLQRHQGPRVVFPALRYLRRAEKESARKIRVRQILLMILRIAAVLLVALAASRPYLRLGGAGHSPTAVALILDNSMSTSVVDGDTRVLDELKARALEVLADAGPDDRFWLVRTAAAGEPALPGDAEATALRVRETEPAAAGADLGQALARARAVLAAGADGRATEIHLLTDLQAASFPGPLPAGAAAPPLIVWHPGTVAPGNRAVAHVELGGGLAPIAGERATVSATIAGDGTEPVNVRLTLDGRLLAAAAARPGATAVLSLPPQPAGLIAGRVDIDADALRADDVRYFVARVIPPPAVAHSGDLRFVEDALEVLARAGRVRAAGLAGADVALLDGAAGAESARGAVVLLPPASPVELPAANRRLAAAGIPWRFGTPAGGEARFAGDDRNDALLRTLEPARLRLAYPLLPEAAGAADSVLLRLSDGAPWAVRGQRRTGGLYVVLGSPLSEEASTIPTSAAMLPLLDRLTGAWTLPAPPRHDVEPGAELAVPPGVTSLAHDDGTRQLLTADGSFHAPAEPGVYRLLQGDSVVAAFAVNPATAESDLERLDRRALQARLPGWDLHATSDAAAWRRAAFRERLGRELWRPLLLALLLVLLVETVVAAAGRTRPRGDPATATPEASGD